MIQGPPCCPDGVRGYGCAEPRAMFIGIAPGGDEWRRTKRPLTGPSGYLLDRLLESQGISRDEVYCTNLICWWNDSPSPEEIKVCAPRLAAEIEQINPKVIYLLGKLACEALLGIPFVKARGAVIRKDGRIWIPTYHPAASLHKAANAREKEAQINIAYSTVRDLEKLADPQRLFRQWPEPIYEIITSIERAQSFLDSLPKDRPVALDIETNYDKEWEKAHPLDSDIVCIGIGYDDTHCTVLVLDEWAQLKWPMDVQYLYHNGPFDTQEIMRHTGVWLPIVYDTMYENYTLDERNPKKGEPGAGLHKLKNISREFSGADFYEEDDHKLPRLTESMTPEEWADYQGRLAKLVAYNAKDVVYTWRDHEYLYGKMDDSDKRVYHELLIPASYVLREAQYRGIYVDREALAKTAYEFQLENIALSKEMNKWAAEVLGDPQFNPRSSQQVRKMLEYQGYSMTSTAKALLLNLVDDNPDNEDLDRFTTNVLRMRTLSKLLDTYLSGIHRQLKYDGRAHPHFYLLGTVTGRLSYQLVQTLPKEKTVKDLQIVRSVFRSTNDDYILVEADYAQIEGWLGAYLAEDDVLWAELESGDWHTATTVNMFGRQKHEYPDKQSWDAARDAGKHINYGIFFNESAQGLTRRPPTGIGCDLATAQAYLAKWKATHWKFVQYQKEQQRLAKEAAYIETPFGRKRRFPILVNDHQLNQAVNSRIQSTAGDYSLSSSIRLAPRLKPLDTHLLFIEHDALYYEVNRRHYEEACHIIKEEMERPPLSGLPSIRAEFDAGQDLAHLSKLCPQCWPKGQLINKVCNNCGYKES